MSWKGGLSSGCVCVQVREGSRLVEHNGFLQGWSGVLRKKRSLAWTLLRDGG